MGDTDSVTAETVEIDGQIFEARVRLGAQDPLEIWRGDDKIAYFSAYELTMRCPAPRWDLAFLAGDKTHISWELRGKAVDVYRRTKAADQ